MSEIPAIHVNEKDTCVTVAEEVHPGDVVKYSLHDGTIGSVVAKDNIPAYHKIAIVDQAVDERVLKYGYPIGIVTKEIEAGQHVHIHNIRSAGLKATKEGACAMSSAELSH